MNREQQSCSLLAELGVCLLPGAQRTPTERCTHFRTEMRSTASPFHEGELGVWKSKERDNISSGVLTYVQEENDGSSYSYKRVGGLAGTERVIPVADVFHF